MTSLTDAISALDKTDRLKALLDDSPLGFFMVSRDGFIEYINHEAARITGFDRFEEAVGYPLHDIESVIGCGLMEAFNSSLSGKSFHRNEHHCTNRLGHYEVINVFCSPRRDADGSVIGFMAIVQDITESYRRKAELEQANEELSVMWQVSEALSSTADLDQVLKIILTGVTANQGLGFNRAFLFLINETDKTLNGEIAVGPRSPEEAGQIWAQLSRNQRTLIEFLNEYLKRESTSDFSLTSLISGWQIPLVEPTIFSRVIDEGVGKNAVVGADLDEESRKILARLQTANLAMAPIISKGRRLGLILADNQISHKPIIDADVQLLQTFANHTAVAIERSRLYDNLVEHAATLEEKNRQLADSQEQLVRIEKMSIIGELTSSIAHELRNPLTVIGGFANLMLSAAGNEAHSEYLNIILSEAKRAESVLHQVLDFSRASRTETRQIDFNQLVRQTYELLVSRIRNSHKQPSLKLTGDNLAVRGNPDQLRHAVYQFMNSTVEELTDECNIEFRTEAGPETVRFVINFIGQEKHRAKVARTLHQVFGSSTGTQKLSIIVAGETIKYHGGSFGLEGTADNMPRIYIELPQKRGDQDAQDTGR
nr:PAS domain-containing protein [candidate division Zixibacteria bacterium]